MTASESIYADFGGLIKLLSDLGPVIVALMTLSVTLYVAGLYKNQKAIDRETEIKNLARQIFVDVLYQAEQLRNGALAGKPQVSDIEFDTLLRDFELNRRKLSVLSEDAVCTAMNEYYYNCYQGREWFGRDVFPEEERMHAAKIDNVNAGYDHLTTEMQKSVSASHDVKTFN
ncbi:hypothetical protein GCM10007385_09200 [Tateyamaria omphalii]|uniref:hypothetical protein n=1 Tax=Tateyamaria omphalii TaxID=299262 RepID=UPI00167A16D6|nr:hypothetical protein [Tateyamaria omphalii]GGX43446.1 hypothetical protein GCM10007385_09200 [Tateyamaria omphalii]